MLLLDLILCLIKYIEALYMKYDIVSMADYSNTFNKCSITPHPLLQIIPLIIKPVLPNRLITTFY